RRARRGDDQHPQRARYPGATVRRASHRRAHQARRPSRRHAARRRLSPHGDRPRTGSRAHPRRRAARRPGDPRRGRRRGRADLCRGKRQGPRVLRLLPRDGELSARVRIGRGRQLVHSRFRQRVPAAVPRRQSLRRSIEIKPADVESARDWNKWRVRAPEGEEEPKDVKPVRYSYGITATLLAGGAAISLITGQPAGAQVAQNDARQISGAVPRAGAPESFADLAEQLAPAVVNSSTRQRITVNTNPFAGTPFADLFGNPGGQPTTREAQSLGSGFLISSDGYVVTNNHVIQPDGRAELEEVTVSL